MAKKTSIRCPHCNCEYLPAEIYFPDQLLGHPSEIIKDESGNILGYQGSDMNTVEQYCCDKCDHLFSIDAVVTFKTTAVNDIFEVDDDFKDIANKNK